MARAVGVGVVGVDTVVFDNVIVVLELGPVLLLLGVVTFPAPQIVIVLFNDDDKATENRPTVVFFVPTERERAVAAVAVKDIEPARVVGSVDAEDISLFAVLS